MGFVNIFTAHISIVGDLVVLLENLVAGKTADIEMGSRSFVGFGVETHDLVIGLYWARP